MLSQTYSIQFLGRQPHPTDLGHAQLRLQEDHVPRIAIFDHLIPHLYVRMFVGGAPLILLTWSVGVATK